MKGVTVALLMGITACAPARLEPGQVDPETPCAERLTDGSDAAWRLVGGQGFNFCVPGDWNQMEPRKWGHAGSWVEWQPGPAPRRVETGTVIVEAVGGRINRRELEDEIERQLGPTDQRELRERIGGRPARLWRTIREGRFYTGVEWTGMLSFVGETSTSKGAALSMEVFRSVRFLEAGTAGEAHGVLHFVRPASMSESP